MLLSMGDYLAINKALRDERAPAHAASADYGFDRFIGDPDYLSGVVRFDRPRLGDLTGQRGVHLQCHIGTDTLSLTRLGARMTGVDFSSAALNQARRLAECTDTDIDFHEAEVYTAVDILGLEAFDLVYTGIGALCWLPEAALWARFVADLLRPGGRLFIREGHPMLWSLDETSKPRGSSTWTDPPAVPSGSIRRAGSSGSSSPGASSMGPSSGPPRWSTPPARALDFFATAQTRF